MRYNKSEYLLVLLDDLLDASFEVDVALDGLEGDHL